MNVTPDPEKLFDVEGPEPKTVGYFGTTATTHDQATGRSMHYPKRP